MNYDVVSNSGLSNEFNTLVKGGGVHAVFDWNTLVVTVGGDTFTCTDNEPGFRNLLQISYLSPMSTFEEVGIKEEEPCMKAIFSICACRACM